MVAQTDCPPLAGGFAPAGTEQIWEDRNQQKTNHETNHSPAQPPSASGVARIGTAARRHGGTAARRHGGTVPLFNFFPRLLPRGIAPASALRLLPLLLTCWAFQAKAQTPTFTYTPTEIYEGETLTFVLTTDVSDEGYGNFFAEFHSTSATHGTDFTVTSVGDDTIAGAARSGNTVYPGASFSCTNASPCYRYAPSTENDDTYDIIIAATTDSTSESDETIKTYWTDGAPNGLIGTITITIKDGQRPTGPRVTVSESTLAVTEGGAVKTYTVKPATDPGASNTATVSATSADTSAVTVSPASLQFTGGSSGTWKTAKSFTVTAIPDADVVNESVVISHTVSGYTGVTSVADVTVGVTDAGHGVAVSESALTLSEAHEGKTYTVRLKSPPVPAPW